MIDDEQEWIGVDLDGTLAYWTSWEQEGIGYPISKTYMRILNWIEKGERVKIFSARANYEDQIHEIRNWLDEYGLPQLEITCVKDYLCKQIWDDRAVSVAFNEGTGTFERVQDLVGRMAAYYMDNK
jgi:hypothetical protein